MEPYFDLSKIVLWKKIKLNIIFLHAIGFLVASISSHCNKLNYYLTRFLIPCGDSNVILLPDYNKLGGNLSNGKVVNQILKF